MKAAYLGPRASFSHQAALEIFRDTTTQVEALPTFADIFEGVQSSQYEYGVVPFENSSNGSVVQLLDLLADRQLKYSDVKVCAEHYLPVHHQLLVKLSGRDAGTWQDGLLELRVSSTTNGQTKQTSVVSVLYELTIELTVSQLNAA